MLFVDNVTRVEVIEDGKRKYVKWNCEPIFGLQDGGRTLKIFINNDEGNANENKTKFKS